MSELQRFIACVAVAHQRRTLGLTVYADYQVTRDSLSSA